MKTNWTGLILRVVGLVVLLVVGQNFWDMVLIFHKYGETNMEVFYGAICILILWWFWKLLIGIEKIWFATHPKPAPIPISPPPPPPG